MRQRICLPVRIERVIGANVDEDVAEGFDDLVEPMRRR